MRSRRATQTTGVTLFVKRLGSRLAHSMLVFLLESHVFSSASSSNFCLFYFAPELPTCTSAKSFSFFSCHLPLVFYASRAFFRLLSSGELGKKRKKKKEETEWNHTKKKRGEAPKSGRRAELVFRKKDPFPPILIFAFGMLQLYTFRHGTVIRRKLIADFGGAAVQNSNMLSFRSVLTTLADCFHFGFFCWNTASGSKQPVICIYFKTVFPLIRSKS